MDNLLNLLFNELIQIMVTPWENYLYDYLLGFDWFVVLLHVIYHPCWWFIYKTIFNNELLLFISNLVNKVVQSIDPASLADLSPPTSNLGSSYILAPISSSLYIFYYLFCLLCTCTVDQGSMAPVIAEAVDISAVTESIPDAPSYHSDRGISVFAFCLASVMCVLYLAQRI